MVRGTITRPVSIAAARPAAPAVTPRRTMAAITTRPVLGASILTRSTGAQRPAPAAARPLMTMRTTVIPMGAGQEPMIRSTSARKPAPLAEILVRNMRTTPMRTATANVTTAVRPSV